MSPICSDDVFAEPYRVTLRREKHPKIGNSVTFILIANGRPRPLADDAWTTLEFSEKEFEIPVFITKNSRTKFEGVLTGTADGSDIRILWSPDLTQKTLGVIKETTNPTVTFVERPGATNW